MLIPYKVDVPMERWPYANWVLMAVTIVISIAMFGPLNDWVEHGAHDFAFENGELRMIPGPAAGALKYFMLQPGHFHPAQLVGNLFTHHGILHLAGNMLFLWVFGNAINAKLGHWQYIAFYLGIGIIEGLVWLAIGPNAPVVGASGAIMGIVGAMFIFYPVNEISVFYWIFALFTGIWEVSTGWIIALYFAMDLWGAVFQQGAGVGYLAHVAGFVAGAAISAALLWWGVLETARGEKSILQVAGWMPYEEDSWQSLRDAYPKTPAQPQVPPPATPRKPRDTGPIPLE